MKDGLMRTLQARGEQTKMRVLRNLLVIEISLIGLLLCLRPQPTKARPLSPNSVTADTSAALHVCPRGCAYASIQAAVDAARDGDIIKIASGIYTEMQARPRNDVRATGVVTQIVYISKTITLRGGYTPTNWTTAYPMRNLTLLDAQRQGRGVYITGHISPTLEGLQITGGDPQGLGGFWMPRFEVSAGGGLYNISATLTLSACQIHNNILEGVFVLAGDNTIIQDSKVSSNTWGGVSAIKSAITLRDNLITGNLGSGVNLWASNHATLKDNLIQANTGTEGGGVSLQGSHVILRDNTICSNTAYRGGGLDINVSDVILTANLIISNTAEDGGGMSLNGHSDASIINSVIADNRATLGGGIYIQGGTPYFIHTTFARNTGTNRRAGASYQSDAGAQGHGIYVTKAWSAYSNVTLSNTILVNHSTGITVTEGNTVTVNGILWSGNGANTGGMGIITIAHAITGPPAFATDGHHLSVWSAAIDRGVNAGVTSDIDGQVRPYGAAPDLGADEYIPSETFVIHLPVVLKQL